MPIIDYKHNAKSAEKEFFANENISDKNKALIEKFLTTYDVSPARYAIFMKHIKLLLQRTDDISKDMIDRDKINNIFKELRDTLSPSYYSTIVNVSLRFVRWVYDDDENKKPKGFKDIKNISKDKQKRELSPKDMITWEDIKKLQSRTASTQVKAILATQLDGGFRPSEFIDLKFGDITIRDDFIIVNVKAHKTKQRNVILWRAVPDLLRWIHLHPTKKRDDPLWLQEENINGGVKQYNYPAIIRRINGLNTTEWDVGKDKKGRYMRKSKKVLIDKPLDFYNLRHSAAVLSKKDNTPEELAAEKFGHSIEYYTNTYGRLSQEDVLKRYSEHYKLTKEQREIKQNINCPRCRFKNEPETETCEQCGAALSVKKALEMEKEKDDKLQRMMDEKIELFKKRISQEVGIPREIGLVDVKRASTGMYLPKQIRKVQTLQK